MDPEQRAAEYVVEYQEALNNRDPARAREIRTQHPKIEPYLETIETIKKSRHPATPDFNEKLRKKWEKEL